MQKNLKRKKWKSNRTNQYLLFYSYLCILTLFMYFRFSFLAGLDRLGNNLELTEGMGGSYWYLNSFRRRKPRRMFDKKKEKKKKSCLMLLARSFFYFFLKNIIFETLAELGKEDC